MDEQTSRILIALQEGLVGVIPSHVRAVTVTWDDATILFDCYYDGDITKEDRDDMALVESEVHAHFLPPQMVTHALHRLDAPARIPSGKRFVFRRKERND